VNSLFGWNSAKQRLDKNPKGSSPAKQDFYYVVAELWDGERRLRNQPDGLGLAEARLDC